MPLIKLNFSPGVFKDDTPLTAEAFYTDADKVRFVRGKAETVGGWEKAATAQFVGKARGLHTWQDNTALAWAGIGTHLRLYGFFDAVLYDITPAITRAQLTNPFSTSSGSAVVTVAHTAHGLVVDQKVKFTGASAVGGITISGEYTVTSVTSANAYTITHSAAASSTAGPAGGTVDYVYYLAPGNADGTGGAGYGTGSYGVGGYGRVNTLVYYARTWAMDNWGQNLLANPRGGGIYEWAPTTSTPELVTNGDFASGASWTTGTNWAIGAGVATKTAPTASDLEQAVTLAPGAWHILQFDYTRTAGTLQPKIGTTNLGSALSAASGRVWLTFFYETGNLKFAADNAFAGTVDNVSVKRLDVAALVTGAPTQCTAMFVTPERIVTALGCSDSAGTLDPMLIRWSDQENNQQWTPNASNQAGDCKLSAGGRVVGGMVGRGENYVFTDTSLYVMRYVPDPNVVYSFAHAGSGCGLMGPNAAVSLGGAVYWMSNTGEFFRYAGGGPEPLQSPVRRDLFDNLAQVQGDKVYAFANAAFNEVWWLYPDSRDGNECSRYVVLNTQTAVWSVGTFTRTAWRDAGVIPYPLAAGSDGYAYYHEKGQTADSAALVWSLTSGAIDQGDGDTAVQFLSYIPDFEDLTGGANLTIKTVMWPNEQDTADERTFGPFVMTALAKKIDLRVVGRQAQFVLSGQAAPARMRMGSAWIDAIPIEYVR